MARAGSEKAVCERNLCKTIHFANGCRCIYSWNGKDTSRSRNWRWSCPPEVYRTGHGKKKGNFQRQTKKPHGALCRGHSSYAVVVYGKASRSRFHSEGKTVRDIESE